MIRKYQVTTETSRYVVDLTEEEVEELYHKHHHFVNITPLVEAQIVADGWEGFKLDLEAIAQELHEGSK